VQWTVDDLDGGGGLMANKNKSLVSESDGNVFVGTNLRWVTRGGSVQFGSGTKLFEKVFSQEFRNLKFYFKNSRFSIFLKSIVPAVFDFFKIHRSRRKVYCDITPAKLVFENGGLLTYSQVSKL
jgi:hypothetical protein